MGHVLMENRHGLVVDGCLTHAKGDAEREAAREMAEAIPGNGRVTLGGDKAYDTANFVEGMRALNVTPHVAQNITGRRSAIDGRTTRHPGYAISLKARKLVEEVFGWMKTVATMRKTRFKGRDRVGWSFVFGLAAYNLVRMRNLVTYPPKTGPGRVRGSGKMGDGGPDHELEGETVPRGADSRDSS
jgi:hypothetical protein